LGGRNELNVFIRVFGRGKLLLNIERRGGSAKLREIRYKLKENGSQRSLIQRSSSKKHSLASERGLIRNNKGAQKGQ
jgi:repressor of nif and glnA expression